jgi:hypothetical protein
MGFFSKLKRRSQEATREAALLQGLRVEDVERDLPIFSRSNDFEGAERLPCVRYSVKRRAGALPDHWLFLQRSITEGAQYPNGWLFQAPQPRPQTLHHALEAIASEWDEELLEFEGTNSEVSAFWAEWGGAEQVAVIQRYLISLSNA